MPVSLKTPLKLYKKVEMRALGQKTSSPSESYHLVKKELEKHPEDAVLQRRMGNLLKNGGRLDLAFPYYLEAVRLNPQEAEALYEIVVILIKQRHYQEAVPYLKRLAPALRESPMDDQLRRGIFSSMLEQAQIIEEKTGEKVEIFPSATPEELKKRNEPVIVDLINLDLSQPDDFDVAYHMFRGEKLPQMPVRPNLMLEDQNDTEETRPAPVVKGKKIGRNEPCPCGSGKKYKKCCGR